MASAATLLSPRLAHGSMMDSSSLSPSPIGLDNLSFDDLVEWNANSYFNNNPNSNSNSPRMSNATLNSNSTSSNPTQPHSSIPQADYSSTSAHINTGNGSDSIPLSNSTTEDLFRHYLSLELRKIGSPVNDSLLDHYVKQHAQGLARVNGGGVIQPSHATSSSSSRENSPPELDPTASNSSSTSSNAASPTFSRRAFSLSPLPEEAGEDQDRTAKAFKIHQENDGQFSHFGRSSLGMGMGMSLEENSGFGNDINGGQQDSEMSSIDPSTLIIKKQSDAISEDEDENGNADETLVDSKNDLAAMIAKNLSEEDSKKQGQSSSTQDTQSSTTNIIPSVEKPPSAFDSFKPPRIGEPPLNPNYSHPSSVKPVLNRAKKNSADDEDEIMITTNAVSYDDPDKPTPEEYKKMTSKEKRQLRNKISARNFRERRKDYIAQLEREMQERDYTIASLRAQLERVGLQNQDLKNEVKTLRSSAAAAAVVPTPETVAPSTKPAATSSGSAIGASISQADVQRILDALQKSTVATQTQPEVAASGEATPRTAPVLSTSTTTATSSRPATPTSLRPISPRPSSSSSPIPVPNTRKDAFLSSDGSNSTSSFWAGGRSNSLLGGSGFMSVHTTLLPTIPFNPTTNVVVKKGKVKGGLSEKKSNFGLTFKGLNNHLRTFKSEKLANNDGSSLPPPAYSDHSFFDFKKSEKMMKKETVGESFDVYDAFASLLNQGATSKQPVQSFNLQEVDEEDRGDEALPTYVESICASSSQPTTATSSLSPSLSDEAIEDRVLEALYKAFSNDNSSTSYPLDSKNSMVQKQDVDLSKIAALLDGKAELVLVDSESRREWNGQEGARVDGGLGYNVRAIMARH